MAHADYCCCACCDSKISYSNDATTKEQICASCAVDLACQGVIAKSGEQLALWIREEVDNERIRLVLSKVGFCRCYYPNEVDSALTMKGLEHIGER